MYFALTDEQRALQETVSDYLADRFPTSAVREVYDDPTGTGIPDKLWKALGEQGSPGGPGPGGARRPGLGLLDAAVVSKCLGAGVTPGPWLLDGGRRSSAAATRRWGARRGPPPVGCERIACRSTPSSRFATG